MASLEVRLGAQPIGVLERTRKGARLRYGEDVVGAYQGRPLLSTSLPVKRRPYGEGLTGAWFENLLPEARHLSLRVNGKVLADDVAREDVVAEAISWGLAVSEAGAIVDETLASLEDGFARAAGLYPSAADRLEAPARRRLALLS